jgi:hypothetical protein
LYAAVVLFGLTWFPLRSHIQFPRQYWPGFPGTYAGLLPEADRYLAPENDPVFRFWPLRAVAGAYRDLMREQTTHFGGIRQEEHRMFLETANAAAGHINDVLARDALPRDLYVAIDCVGAVPYRTDLRILDRLGLTTPTSRTGHSSRRQWLMASTPRWSMRASAVSTSGLPILSRPCSRWGTAVWSGGFGGRSRREGITTPRI